MSPEGVKLSTRVEWGAQRRGPSYSLEQKLPWMET